MFKHLRSWPLNLQPLRKWPHFEPSHSSFWGLCPSPLLPQVEYVPRSPGGQCPSAQQGQCSASLQHAACPSTELCGSHTAPGCSPAGAEGPQTLHKAPAVLRAGGAATNTPASVKATAGSASWAGVLHRDLHGQTTQTPKPQRKGGRSPSFQHQDAFNPARPSVEGKHPTCWLRRQGACASLGYSLSKGPSARCAASKNKPEQKTRRLENCRERKVQATRHRDGSKERGQPWRELFQPGRAPRCIPSAAEGGL